MPNTTHLTALASRLETLRIERVATTQLGFTTYGLRQDAFPQLRILAVDTSFDCLPLVSHVAENSPLLKSLTVSDLPDYSYYLAQGARQDVVAGSLLAAVAHMANLTALSLTNGLLTGSDIVTMLNEGDLAERLHSLGVVVSSCETIEFLLSRCVNVYDLTLLLDSEGEWKNGFHGVSNLNQLCEVVLAGKSMRLITDIVSAHC